jgi:hypothetical protein
MTEEEVLNAGAFRQFNVENKKWYMNNREEIDANTHSVHKIGDGIQIEPQNEPFFRFKALRNNIFIK